MKKIRNGPPSSSIQQQAIPQQPQPSAPELRVVTNRNRNLINSERRNRDKLSGVREPSPSPLPSPAVPVLAPGQIQEAARTQTGAGSAARLTQARTGRPPLTEPAINAQTRSRSQQQQQQRVTTAAEQQPRKFNFEQTLKDFGFNPQLLTSSPFNNDKPKENVVTKTQQLKPVQSFPSARPGLGQGFTGRGRVTEENLSADVSPQPVISQTFLQSQPEPILSPNRAAAGPSFSRGQSQGRGTGDRSASPGLSSLLAIAGDPQECYTLFKIILLV